jgi:hypothetical protein
MSLILKFLRDVWIRTHTAALARRRAANLATHNNSPFFFIIGLDTDRINCQGEINVIIIIIIIIIIITIATYTVRCAPQKYIYLEVFLIFYNYAFTDPRWQTTGSGDSTPSTLTS